MPTSSMASSNFRRSRSKRWSSQLRRLDEGISAKASSVARASASMSSTGRGFSCGLGFLANVKKLVASKSVFLVYLHVCLNDINCHLAIFAGCCGPPPEVPHCVRGKSRAQAAHTSSRKRNCGPPMKDQEQAIYNETQSLMRHV